MAANREQPRLERIYVAFNGTIKAVYEDNTLLILSAEGHSFTHVSPAGVKTVQLCEFCLSRFTPLLTELLDFRNQHVDVPALCRPFLQQLAKHAQQFQMGYPIADICWPATVQEAYEQGLVELSDKQRIVVHSKCSSARVVLEYTGLRFAVCYPLLINHDPATNTYTYTWQTQVFSRNQYPARWQPALSVASAVADNAARGFLLPQQQTQNNQQPQQQLLADLTNRPSSCRTHTAYSSCSSPVRCSSPCKDHNSSSPGKRFGSPLQRQHEAWQEPLAQQQHISESPGPPLGSAGGHDLAARQGSPSRLARRLQEHYCSSSIQTSHNPNSIQALTQQTAALAVSPSTSNSSSCVTQLPISDKLLYSLPAYQQELRQQQRQQSSSSARSSKLAAALAQALGQRHNSSSISSGNNTRSAAAAVAAGGLGRGWWLEPSLLLPSDDLLQMVWTREATVVFVKDVEEVEVWVHADDSCLYSFQAGAFVTHLLPRAPAAAWETTAAADSGHSSSSSIDRTTKQFPAQAGTVGAASSGWHSTVGPNSSSSAAGGLSSAGGISPNSSANADKQGCPDPDSIGLIDRVVDAADMSRVYAASALPEVPVTVTVLGSDGVTDVVRVPVGQIAAAALKFRSAMTRIKRCQAPTVAAAAAADNPIAVPSAATSRPSALPSGFEQQQQQHTISTDIQEQQDVPGLGNFVAYADGRIRVVFADRTILNLTADHSSASLVMSDGSCRTVPTAKPLGVEQYVQAALEFAAWSTTSPEQRAAALRLQALVAAELRSSARMAAICEWGSTQRLPNPVAEAAACEAAEQQEAEEYACAAAAEMTLEAPAWAIADATAGIAATAPGRPESGSSNGELGRGGASSLMDSGGSYDSFAAQSSGLYGLAPIQTRPRTGHATAGNGGLDLPAGGLIDRQLAVEEMLQANARLLQRLQV